ncbi:MAG TPA: MarR family transcriptional regulator [Syntrophomonadaceae bacterium]|nr:MarR family transcriptional regulator [Syntrophomonadaceae bacterium]
MDQEEARELHVLLFAFLGMFHEKFLLTFRKENKFPANIKKNQGKILNMLYHSDKLTSTELGRRLDIEKGSLTSMIDQLEEMELVVRSLDPDDRRKFLLSLSPAGRQEMDKMMDKYTENLIELFADVIPQEQEQFFTSLRYVVEFMNRL